MHTPEGIFVIHLRSDSDVSRRRFIGRVEHVLSGSGERFVSLDGLFAFMARSLVDSVVRPSEASEAASTGPAKVRRTQLKGGGIE